MSEIMSEFMDGNQRMLQNVIDVMSCATTPAPGGRFFQLTERNAEMRDSAFTNFDMKRPSSGNATNITEHVTVPTSEHVAEIVGRQGCKIKALRNKTNTYIKTPGRGEAPLFVITGQKNDVEMAVMEIKQASMHFTNIRAQRSKGISPPNIEGSITDRVQVPYRVVGLVVGPKGQTIKQIQVKTDTFIVTPSRERDPIFEITGLAENVAKAREEIINYICIRTGMALEENNMGHFIFNSTEQEKLDLINQQDLYQNMGSKRNFPLPSFSQENFPVPFSKTPTGVWNPIKQEIEELPGNQECTFPEFHTRFQSSGVNYSDMQDRVYADISPERFHQSSGVFPEIQAVTSLLSHNIQAPKTTPTQGKTSGKHLMKMAKFVPGMEMGLDLENDENCGPIRSAAASKRRNSELVSTRSPLRGLNVQTYDPFCWDNSSLLTKPLTSPTSPPKTGVSAVATSGVADLDNDFGLVHENLQDLQLGAVLKGSDSAKVSPLSNGSQHSSSTDSHSSLGSLGTGSGAQPLSDVMGGFAGSLLGQWNPSSVPTSSLLPDSIATSVASNALTGSDFGAASANIPDCWVLSPPKPAAVSKPVMDTASQKCHVCLARTINAALVPCGHNHFCYECASACVGANCPSCASEAKNALRIFK